MNTGKRVFGLSIALLLGAIGVLGLRTAVSLATTPTHTCGGGKQGVCGCEQACSSST